MSETQKSLGWFNDAVNEINGEIMAVMNGRGEQYGDSWGEDGRFVNTRQAYAAVSHLLNNHIVAGSEITIAIRLIAIAAMVDVKINRMVGGYKEDTFIDLANYSAGLVKAWREFNHVLSVARFAKKD